MRSISYILMNFVFLGAFSENSSYVQFFTFNFFTYQANTSSFLYCGCMAVVASCLFSFCAFCDFRNEKHVLHVWRICMLKILDHLRIWWNNFIYFKKLKFWKPSIFKFVNTFSIREQKIIYKFIEQLHTNSRYWNLED